MYSVSAPLVGMVAVLIYTAFLIAEILFALGLEKDLQAEIEQRMPHYLPSEDSAG